MRPSFLGRATTTAGLALLVLACSDLLVPPAPPSPSAASLSLSLARTGGAEAAFDRADRIRVQLLHEGAAALDTTLAFASGGADTRLLLPVDEGWARTPLVLRLELSLAGAPLFQASHPVVLEGTTTRVEAVLEPVAAALALPHDPPVLTALGEGPALAGAALFATGDTVPGAELSWRSLEPAVVEVGPSGRLVARSEGSALVEGSFGALADTVRVRVRAEVARIVVSPDTLTLAVGEGARLSAAALDSNGNALQGRALAWSSSQPDLAPVDPATGEVRALRAGIVTVAATFDDVSGRATVTLANPRPAISGFQPATLSVGGEGATLTVTGSGFVDGSQVRWNGDALPTRFVSASRLEITLAETHLSRTGDVPVTVVNPAPGGGTSGAVRFRVLSRARLRVSETEVEFHGTLHDAPPAARSVEVTNGGEASLTGLSVRVHHGSGPEWLSATLDRTSAPALLTLRPTTTDLPEGIHTATVTVASSTPGAGEETLEVRYRLTEGRVVLRVEGRGYGAGRVYSVPQGIDCIILGSEGETGACSAWFPDGTAVDLRVEEMEGSLFRGWGGVCAEATCELVVGAEEQTATARFESAHPPAATLGEPVVTSESVLLRGNVEAAPPEPLETYFEVWPQGAPGGGRRCFDRTAGAVAGTAPTCALTDLIADTTYLYRLVATGAGSELADTVSGSFRLVSPPRDSHWRAEGDYADSGPAGNHGTPTGEVGFSPYGYIGQAFEFMGSDFPAEVRADDGGGLRTATRVTLAAWVNLDESESGTGVRRFVSLLPERAVLRLDGRFGPGVDHSLHFYVNTSAGPVGLYVPDVLWERGCWYHAAATYDGSTARLYLNGVEVASAGEGGLLDPGEGGGILLSNTGGFETLHGLLDEVRVYGRALTPAEIGALAAVEGEGPVCSGELALARLPDAAGAPPLRSGPSEPPARGPATAPRALPR